MSSTTPYSPRSSLRPLKRHITTHDALGKATFSNTVPSDAHVRQSTGGAMEFSLMYTNKHDPLRITDDADIEAYTSYLKTPPALTIPGGTVCRTVDFAPGYTSPMHRTVSLDFGVVVEGEVELQLDSGEIRLLKRGDVAVQRGTNHAWRNTSQDQWCRMLYVLQAAESVTLGGNALDEDEGGID
jgi:quercetin dioxygenase-like cupin family protein